MKRLFLGGPIDGEVRDVGDTAIGVGRAWAVVLDGPDGEPFGDPEIAYYRAEPLVSLVDESLIIMVPVDWSPMNEFFRDVIHGLARKLGVELEPR